jgi:hypothetical protein
MQEFGSIITKQYRGNGFMTVSKYNNKGDLLYIADKESKLITAVSTHDHKIIGDFIGHNGIVWNLDITHNDNIMISCSGDMSIIFWNAKTGEILRKNNQKGIPKYVATQKLATVQNNYVVVYNDALTKRSKPTLEIYDTLSITPTEEDIKSVEPIKKYDWDENKPTVVEWFDENSIIIGCDDGTIYVVDITDDTLVIKLKKNFHSESIKSIVFNKLRTDILTSSNDCTSKIINVINWEVKKEFVSKCPINYAVYNKNERKVILGGGVEAMLVAKTSVNDLNIKIFNIKTGKLGAQMSSHFGPIRYISQSPSSKNFTTASQDGTVKIYIMNEFEEDNQETSTESNAQIKTESEIVNYSLFGSVVDCDPEELVLMDEITKLSRPVVISNNPKKNIKPVNPAMNTYVIGSIKKIEPGELEKDDEDEAAILFKISKRENSNASIRISNLPKDIRLDELWERYEFFGRIEEKGIKIKNFGGDTVAFINYINRQSAEKAIEATHRKPLEYSILNVEFAIQR